MSASLSWRVNMRRGITTSPVSLLDISGLWYVPTTCTHNVPLVVFANENKLLSIWTAAFLSAFDTTVGMCPPLASFHGIRLTWLVATLLGSISSDFNEANMASWLGTA